MEGTFCLRDLWGLTANQRRGRAMIRLGFDGGDGGYQELVDELIEAHMDTIEMLVDCQDDPSWQSHAMYLKGLVRQAKRLTAERAGGGVVD